MDNNQTLPITQKSQLERLVERMHREHTESLRDLHDEIRRLQELCAEQTLLRVLGDELLQVKYEKKCREVEELQKALAAGELRYQQLKQEQSTRREEQQQQQMETEDADYSDMTINQHLPLTNPLKQSLLTRPVIPLAPPIGLKQQQQQHQQQQRNSNWLASMMTRRQRRPPIIKPASIDDCSNILKLPPIDHQASNTIQ